MLFRDPHWWIAHNNDWYDFGSHRWTGIVVRAVSGRIPHLAFGLKGDVCTVVGVSEEIVQVRIADQVKIQLAKSAVARRVEESGGKGSGA